MIFLFIHQNFPAQYVHIVRHLASKPEHRVLFITQAADGELEGVEKHVYRPQMAPQPGPHPYNAQYESAVRTGLAVMQVCRGLREQGVNPDIIVGHCGWGETLLVKDAYPDVPVLSYFEYFYHAKGADVGFDPEFSPSREDDSVRLWLRNAVARMSFAGSDWGHTATHWQRSLFPAEMQERISVLHEGIDTGLMKPDAHAWLELADGLRVTQEDEVITFVARNLEPYRGFHWFMRALPELLRRRPRAQVIVLGGDGISYGDPPPYGGTYRQMMLSELGERLDRERVHFLGQVPKETYLNVLQVSSVHVYFTYPFVLSWSLLEAMAAGCLVLGSDNAPVTEVVDDGVNGLLVNMRDAGAICDAVDAVLDHEDRMQALRDAARDRVLQKYDLRTHLLPTWERLLADMAAGELPAHLPSSN
jgi:glycosyltransferase involved in cell wall biosynthesis